MTRSISAIFILSLVWTNASAGEPEPPEPNPSGPTILHEPVTTAPTGQPVRVRADITDPDGIFAPAVYVRAQGSDRYVSIPMKLEDGVYAAVVPAELVVQDLEYFVEAFDELGHGPSRRGAPEAPLLIRVSAPSVPKVVVKPPPENAAAALVTPPPSVEQKDDHGGVLGSWWFWTVIGVVVAGSAAGAAYALTRDGDVDAVSIDVRGPDPTRGLP